MFFNFEEVSEARVGQFKCREIFKLSLQNLPLLPCIGPQPLLLFLGTVKGNIQGHTCSKLQFLIVTMRCLGLIKVHLRARGAVTIYDIKMHVVELTVSSYS